MRRYVSLRYQRSGRKRGAVAVLTMVTIPVLLCFAALAVDVGLLYNARGDLQRAADAGAMAGAGVLTSRSVDEARSAAVEFVEQNPALGRKVTVDSMKDVVFGRANYDPQANAYHFTATTILPDAVQVTVRFADDSPNGPLPLVFARIFGKPFADVSATAIAAVAPRDIALVADLSGSHTYDSLLKNYKDRKINLYDVWDAFPGGADDDPSTWAPGEVPGDVRQAAGPGWGFYKKLAFGADPAEDDYNPASDPGLIRLPKNQTWSDATLAGYLADRGYSGAEIDAILNPYNENMYRYRVAVASGLAFWNSGMPGGLWSPRGVAPADTGNGNTAIAADELDWVVPVFDHSLSDSADIWLDYIDYATKNDEFRYRFGIKTFIGFVLDQRRGPDRTPEIANVPVQPFQAVKDGTRLLVDLLEGYNSSDRLSLETYINVGRHEVDLTSDFRSVSDRLNAMAPNEYGSGTNIGAGLKKGIQELTSNRVRGASRKVILLLTDGIANRDEYGHSNVAGAKAYTLEQAQIAASLGIQIITISVGQGADKELMSQVATIGNGTHLHAEGSIEAYSEQLAAIFTQIGGQRTVELIQ